jgi:hypothetical protein
MTLALLLVFSSLAAGDPPVDTGPVAAREELAPFAGALQVLAQLTPEAVAAPALCWQPDDTDAVVLAVCLPDGRLEPVDGPRAPTLEGTLSQLDPASTWLDIDPATVAPCSLTTSENP